MNGQRIRVTVLHVTLTLFRQLDLTPEAWARKTAGQSRSHLPVQRGARFSRKARTPSLKSALV